MSKPASRFGVLAQAIKSGTEVSGQEVPARAVQSPKGAGVHKPAVALNAMGESLRDHVSRLQSELSRTSTVNTELSLELERLKGLSRQAGDAIEEFIFLAVETITDPLPKDRLRGASEGHAFEELLADIEKNGQNDAITVRRMPKGDFQIAAGRRRLAACRQLGRAVLARVRDLDDQAMLRIQYSENERRTDISALERARWFSDVRDRLRITSKEIAEQFGIDPSTFSLYLRLARFPEEILERLDEPGRLAIVPARRVMEAIEGDPQVLHRIIAALDVHRQSVINAGTPNDPTAQINVLLQAAEGREGARSGARSPVPERRVIVHQGRRIGTLTRNGGQWVFRFATAISDHDVQVLAERLAAPVPDSSDSASDRDQAPISE
jgi:ParB family chromosome partitioning protein